MRKRKITKEESIFISQIFNKKIKKSVFFIIILLSFLGALLYCLFVNWLEFWIVNLALILILSLVGFLFVNSIYSIISLNRKIKNCEIEHIEAEFKVWKKDILTHTDNTSSDSKYYKIFLINIFSKEKKRIYVEKEDYTLIKLNDMVKLMYYDKVNISSEVFHNNKKIQNTSFF